MTVGMPELIAISGMRGLAFTLEPAEAIDHDEVGAVIDGGRHARAGRQQRLPLCPAPSWRGEGGCVSFAL
jgi:hypothetical protein